MTNGSTTGGISVRLRLGGTIAGTVTNAAGRSLRGICVLAATSPSPGVVTVVESATGAGGKYRVSGLTSGQYQLQFSAGCGASGYSTRWYKNARASSHATVVQVTVGQSTAGIGITLPRG